MEKKETKKCCICGKKFEGWGNNPMPVKESGVCCDECNINVVLVARLRLMYEAEEKEKVDNAIEMLTLNDIVDILSTLFGSFEEFEECYGNDIIEAIEKHDNSMLISEIKELLHQEQITENDIMSHIKK